MADLAALLDGPPRHLERFSPPWASERWTVCGRLLDDVTNWLSWDDAKAAVKELGQTRAQLMFCQTCLQQQTRAQQPTSWTNNPLVVVNDYTRHHRHYYSGKTDVQASFDLVRAELLALARLVELHPDEYTAIVTAYQADEVTARRISKGARRG